MAKKHNNSKKYYFIDYENVHKTGINGLVNLDASDNVIIFYSGNADKLTFDIHKQILDSKAKITYFEVNAGGKNALDFQLSSYLGYIIGNKKKYKCYIVSNDRGFEYIRDFWRKMGVKIEIISDIGEISKSYPEENEKTEMFEISESDFIKTIGTLKLNKQKLNLIWKIFESNMKQTELPLPKRKQQINSELCKNFGNNETKKIYEKIKPFFK